jgi:NADH/F420H2 dehydrogenase subunit C
MKFNKIILNNKQEFDLILYAKFLLDMLPKYIEKVHIYKDELILFVKLEFLLDILQFLKLNSNCLFNVLVDITAIDYPEREKRFELVYQLLSVKYNIRLRIKVLMKEEAVVKSASSIYKSSLWLEREIWDMFGIFFSEHPDLRRILTDYGFEGFPLRKDFPLSGFNEVRYDDEVKRIIYEPIEITQEFRSFDFLSPWEKI